MTIAEIVQQAFDAQESQLDAFRKVETAFHVRKIAYSARPSELRYNIPNLHLCFETVLAVAQEALQGTGFYPQEMPYKEMMKIDQQQFPVEYLLILHQDDRQ